MVMMVVMVVIGVMMMVMMMVVVMVLHRSSGWRRRGFLRNGVTGEADAKRGRGDESLDHGKVFLCLDLNPSGSMGTIGFAA
jgi:hypothetical protein